MLPVLKVFSLLQVEEIKVAATEAAEQAQERARRGSQTGQVFGTVDTGIPFIE